MKLIWMMLLLMGPLMTSCNLLEEDEDDDEPRVSYDCEFTTETTYTIAYDVTGDFMDSSVNTSSEIISSTCDGVDVGDTSYDSVDSIVRSGDSITMTDEGAPDTIKVNGSSLYYPGSGSAGDCLNGAYVFAEFLGGEVVSSNDTLVVRVKGSIDFDYCSSFVRESLYHYPRPTLKNLVPFI